MAGRLRTIDARTLADAVLEPPGYAVKDLLVQGLHILAGAPKTGKSWLALWLCQQVAGGEKVWGYPTQQGTVLYLCLEDGYHRLQDRLLDITEDPSENLYLATHAGTLADGLAGQIETFVREHGRVSLIVIDTLQKFVRTIPMRGTMPTWRGSKSWPTAARPLCCWSTICASSMTATR